MIMNMAGGGSSAKWATGTSATISGLKFVPTKIYVFGTYERMSYSADSNKFVRLFNCVQTWAEFTVDKSVITKENGHTTYSAEFQDSNNGTTKSNTIPNRSQYTLEAADGVYTIGQSSATNKLNVLRWFAMK